MNTETARAVFMATLAAKGTIRRAQKIKLATACDTVPEPCIGMHLDGIDRRGVDLL